MVQNGPVSSRYGERADVTLSADCLVSADIGHEAKNTKLKKVIRIVEPTVGDTYRFKVQYLKVTCKTKS
jgi:hypothetical protein